MTRIRYSKDDKNPEILSSNQDFLLESGKLIVIHLNTNTNVYEFIDLDNAQVISSGKADSLIALKKLVRETLLDVGYPLEVEVKKFKKTEVAA